MTMIQRLRRCVSAHDIEPIQAALVILIVAIGALSITTFRSLDRANTNADQIDDAVQLAKEAQVKLDIYQRLACERGNVLRAYLIIRGDLIGDAGGSVGAARTVFEITDCSGDGRAPATPKQSSEYLLLIAKQMGVLNEWKLSRN